MGSYDTSAVFETVAFSKRKIKLKYWVDIKMGITMFFDKVEIYSLGWQAT